MIPAQPTSDEPSRIEALRRYAVLDTSPEQALDDLTALAAQICGVPIAMISLVDENRQWFKAKLGMDMAETSRDISFCGHAVHQRDLFIVTDAARDERFADNPLVTGEPRICFYAGVPLVSPEDAALGALCVIDHVPRTLTESQEQALRVLARQVMTHLELRRHARELVESEERLRVVTDNARVGLVIVNQDRRYIYANNAYAELLGLPSPAIVGQRVPDVLPEIYEEQIRPRLDRAFTGERVSYELRKSAADGEYHYEIRYEPTLVEGIVQLVVVVVTDITERKRAEAIIKQFFSIIESSDDAIISKTLDGIITSWNPAAERMFGYSAQEIIGKPIILLFPSDRIQEEEEILARIAKGERVQHFETVRVRKDGQHLDVSATISPIKNAEGKIAGVSKIIRDITERKKAESALKKNEGQFRLLVDQAVDAFFLHDANGKFLEVNHRACESLGYSREELLKMKVSDVSSLKENEVKSIWDQIQAGSTATVDDYHRRKDGTFFPVEIRVGGLDVDGQRLFLGLARDITERKRAEKQIAEQASFLDKARDAIVALDLEGKVVFWNKGAEHIYGWTREEVFGRDISGLLGTDLKKFEEVKQVMIQLGEWQGERQHLTKDRRELTVEARTTLIRDNKGQPEAMLSIITDITEKKKLEAQFMRAQRMESIGTLAGGVAHDLNNILAPIMMSIDVLKTLSDKPQVTTILETIEVSAKRGADIVRQVLSFARGLEGQRIEVQPKHLFKDLENIIKDTFPKDIRLQFSIPNDTWTILGDPTQVHQILLNLCVNARDAMPNGGNLTIGVENCVLDEQYAAMNIQAKPGRYVNISVTDSGTGMPADLIDKIFEPFFTTKALNKGTGLGLSTVMAIVKSHDGIVNVYSEPGKGTTFKVYLPAMETSLEARKEQSEAASLPRGNGETVLVVDDEASILTITSQTLQAFGYRVLTAMDGADALSVYVQHRNEIAVVLTDMMMPVLDGPATIHALMRINPAVKIVAASGLNANGGVAKASGAGIKHFLTKPYTAGTLLKAMRAILDEA